MSDIDLFHRVNELERQVVALEQLAARLLAIQAAHDEQYPHFLCTNEGDFNSEGLATSGSATATTHAAYSVSFAGTVEHAGKYQLEIATATAHTLRDYSKVILSGAGDLDGTHRVRLIDATHFAFLHQDEDFDPPSFGVGGATVKRAPEGVRLNILSAEEGTGNGYVLSTEVALRVPASFDENPRYCAAGNTMVINRDPLSRNPASSLYVVNYAECWAIAPAEGE